MQRIVAEIYPEDYVAVVDGGHDVADLCLAQRFDKIFYTGSPKVGVHVLEKAAKHLTPVALELGGDALAPLAVKAFPKLKTDAQTDVVRWLGNRHDTENIEAVFRALGSSNSQLVDAALEAAGKIGGVNAMSALIVALSGNHAETANAALTTFNGDISEGVLAALKGSGTLVTPALVALAGERRIYEAYQPLTQLIGKDGVHYAAVKSLAQIVKPDQYADLLKRFEPYPENYYGLLAQRAGKEDIQQLVAAAKEGAAKKEATAALLKVNSSDVVAPLMSLAAGDAAGRDALLSRALTLIQGANWPRIDKYQLMKQAL